MSLPQPPVDQFRLGLGTGTYQTDDDCREGVRTALDQGYRHVDTASAYDNERAVRAGIEASTVGHEDVIVATKIHSQQLAPADLRASVADSASKLGRECLDLVYVHWPAHTYDPAGTLSELQSLQEAGRIERIGLSNFTVDLLDDAAAILDQPIFAVQAEFHPFCQQRALRQWARDHDTWVVASCPLMQGDVFEVELLVELAEDYETTPPVVALSWAISKPNVCVIPKASGGHIRHNYEALSVELSPDDRRRIDQLERTHRYIDYEFAPWND